MDYQTTNEPVSLPILENFVRARQLFGDSATITLASIVRKPEDSNTVINGSSEPADSIKITSHTSLNLHIFSLPSQKSDSFSTLQKCHRRWWKLLLNQPELLGIRSKSHSSENVEQIVEFHSPTMENYPLETINAWCSQIFDEVEMGESMRSQVMVRSQRKSVWPSLITSQIPLETATWFFLMDAFTTRNKTSSVSLHHLLSPYKVAIIVEEPSSKMDELKELRQLLVLKLRQVRVSVLSTAAAWSFSQCDARAVNYLVILNDTTLSNGICRLRNRDTSLKEEVHVSDVVPRLKNVLDPQ
nr:EOG090X076T [Cyclestheria hislopi]